MGNPPIWRIVYSHRPTSSAHGLDPSMFPTDLLRISVHFTAEVVARCLLSMKMKIYIRKEL